MGVFVRTKWHYTVIKNDIVIGEVLIKYFIINGLYNMTVSNYISIFYLILNITVFH